ncbi:TVP38/TMEM64 family protein [Candidatus Saccharibacteria bacterium]|nr:TVP38/TMEM64 family protein [Candidatus Saccharibacteria bacterium]
MGEQIFKKRISKKTKVEIALVVLAIVAIGAYLVWDIITGGPLTQLFNNREELIEIVQKLGPLGPIAYMGLQILQTVVAPIPGNVVGAIGGLLFGWWGVLWTTIGATIGAALVFWVSRRFGRKLVEKLVKKESLDKFDFVIGKRASIILFLIFLIPGLPDDIVCYVAGLTDVPIKKLIIIFALGRLPAVVSNNIIGAGLSQGNVGLVITLVVVGVIIFGILYWQQENIMKLLGRQSDLEKQNKALKRDLEDYADDGKLNNSIAKKSKKS